MLDSDLWWLLLLTPTVAILTAVVWAEFVAPSGKVALWVREYLGD